MRGYRRGDGLHPTAVIGGIDRGASHNLTIAGDDAIAKPPTPAVSVLRYHPGQQQRRQRQIRGRTDFNGIGRSLEPAIASTGNPNTKFTPLRAITVTIELNGTLARHPSLLYRRPSTD